MKKIYVLFLLFVVSAQSIAQPVGSPPQEAFESCANSSQGSSCSFNAPHGRITGTCRNMREGKLICVPSNKMGDAQQNSSQSTLERPRGNPEKMMRVAISSKSRDGKAVRSLVPDTNQGSCFDDSSLISCPKVGENFYGQDGNYFGATPNYRNNKDGTISDLVTGLTWQKAHNSNRQSYYKAKEYCESLTIGGYEDWRLPTIKELFSIADFRGAQGKNYFLNSTYFDLAEPDESVLEGDRYASTHNVAMMGQTWSSTIYTGKHFGREGVEAAFFFNFLDGHIKQAPTNERMSLFYRCVRGNIWGENQFVDNSDNTVSDKATTLQWQQKDDGKTYDWKGALAYCQNLELAGYNDWRLPNVKELQTIVDYTKNSPALNEKYLKITNPKAWF